MLAVNEWTAVEVNGGFQDQISPFRPGKAALLKLKDGSWVQVPGNPTTWIFAVARALGKEQELVDRGWLGPRDTQGQDAEIKKLMQSWASEFANVREFEQALEKSRTPLGTVKALKETVNEDWAIARQAFVDVDVHGQQVTVPRSPMRFSSASTGPSRGATRRGEENRDVLRAVLGLDDAALDALEAEGVLSSEAND